jgi:hypothetical protein
MGSANDALRFTLELAALASRGYWGFAEHDAGLQWLLLELAVFGGGVAALWAADSHMLAFGFGVLVVLHLAFTFLLDQRPATAS